MLRLSQTLKHTRQLLNINLHSSQYALQQQATRSFALFAEKPQTNKQTIISPIPAAESIRDKEEIIRNIEGYKNSIKEKTQQGFTLASKLSKTVEENKFKKIQRFEIFINKMTQLYKSELRFQKKQNAKFAAQNNAILYSLTPLKEILKIYNELTSRGFNSAATVQTLQAIANALRARGYQGRVMGDYSISELDDSWRMQKLVDDIKFGLKEDEFYSPAHLAQTSMKLGEIGYKSTDLIPRFFQKLNLQIQEAQKKEGRTEAHELSFLDAVYGGPKGFVSRHYVFKGFQKSEEFNEYLQILMEWEKEPKQQQSKQKIDKDAEELQKSMNDVINAAISVREFQKDYQASIESLRQQYYLMQQAADKNKFLQENPYIKYDLLELQELLVKGGYLEPEEALKNLVDEPFEQKMNRASEVFYDYVLNYAPELISPQYNSFYDAAVKNIPQKKDKFPDVPGEGFNNINLANLSDTIVGLSKQALSYRRDTNRNDYLNKFYEEYLMPEEKQLIEDNNHKMAKVDTVLMERSYLKAWQIFKQEVDKLMPALKKSAMSKNVKSFGRLHALNALSAARLDEPEVRKHINEFTLNTIAKMEKKEKIGQHDILAGLKGLACSPSLDEKGMELAKQLATRANISGLQFPEQLDMLWSLFALKQYDNSAIKEGIEYLNSLTFERIDNDLKFEEYQQLIDINNALKFEAPQLPQITNKGLLMGLNGQDTVLKMRFTENFTKYDPFKQRVVQALAKGLTNASIDHQVIMENELYNTQTLDTNVLNSAIYPYKPDVIFGYKGTKVGVFVFPEIQATRDTHLATGPEKFRMRILEAANKSIKTAAIAVDNVIHYDIEKLHLELNKDFNFEKTLESQIKFDSEAQKIDFSSIGIFGENLMKQVASYIDKQSQQKDVQKIDALIKKLYQIFTMKTQIDLRFEASQKNAGYDDLRFQLMKLSLIYDSLNKEGKEFVDKCSQPYSKDFSSLLKKTVDTIPKEAQENELNKITSQLSSNWLGTRLEVELPVKKQDASIRKSIVPEIINQKFMWVDDYFHYDDWKLKQKKVFDNFNLLVVPPHQNLNKFFFDKDHYNRCIPQGIFPYPTFKRSIMLPSANNSVTDLLKNSKYNDEFVLFEKEPYKMMVINELKKAEKLSPIDDETSMITNLQNIKQGLKSDFTDREILNMVLLNLNFTDQLIEEHLGLNSKNNQLAKHAKYLPRDSSKFREFIESTYFSKDREDPYTHFYLKESAQKEQIKKLMENEKHLQKETEDESSQMNDLRKGEKRREKLQDKIDDMLMSTEQQNEDMFNLSQSLKSSINVNYDLKTLVKSEYVYDVDPELVDSSLTDDEYLNLYRRRAEAKLIKTKIIYKLYQGGQELTANEKEYVKQWMADIKERQERTLGNLRDSMLPKEPSKLTIGDIEAKSLYTLNSISKVDIQRDKHGKFSLNDLIVELSHLLDEEVVNKVETEVYSERLRKQWGLSKGFKAVETRNKEINLVLNEFEEVAWRSAGQFTDKDLEYIKRMISIKRNKDFFDKQFYESDMKSFKNFMEAINMYDDRINLLEKWLVRKEDEIKQRVVLPTQDLKKSDQELFAKVDAPLKKAREQLAAKLLIADEKGNPIQKEYKDLTSKELHSLTENISLRLYLFNYDYPRFLPQVVKAIFEHPNLLKSDKDQLDIYCKMFELDWRGDKTYKNKQEFMSTNPIYIHGDNLKSSGEITGEVIKEKLQRACAPYVEDAASKLQQSIA